MADKTTTQTQTAGPALAKPRGDVVISRERLPMPIGVEQRFGIDRSSWRALCEAVFPMAKTPEAIILALAYCAARKLDVFKRVVHIVPMWNSELNREVETVWPGIAEHRVTASRTGSYAGNDECRFGDWKEQKFQGAKTTRKGKKVEAALTMRFPEWAQFTCYRMVQGQRIAFVGPKIYFVEFFGYRKGLPVPNDRWHRAPSQMLEKCAEAGALRRAYPEEFADQPVAEEMEGRIITAGGVPVGAGEPEPKPTDFKPDRGVPKDGVTIIDNGEDDDDFEDDPLVHVVDEKKGAAAKSPADAAKPSETAPAKADEKADMGSTSAIADAPSAPVEKTNSAPAAQGSPRTGEPAAGGDPRGEAPAPAGAKADAAPDAKTADPQVEEDDPAARAELRGIDSAEAEVTQAIDRLGEFRDKDGLKEFARRTKETIDAAPNVPASVKARLRGKLNAAVLERERTITRGPGR